MCSGINWAVWRSSSARPSISWRTWSYQLHNEGGYLRNIYSTKFGAGKTWRKNNKWYVNSNQTKIYNCVLCPHIAESLPVFFILLHNLPMGDFISNSSNITLVGCNGEEISTTQTTHAASDVVGAQVGNMEGSYSGSNSLLLSPVLLNFSFNTVVDGTSYRCVYWNFSDP